jgi:hypothetical protein
MENTQETQEQEGTTTPKTRRINATRSLPVAQHDLMTLAENVSKKWIDTPVLTLLWTNPVDFKKLVQEFRIFLESRVEAGSGRSSQTQTLKDLDKQINKAVEEIKLAILVKFGKDKGRAYYSEFGISKQGSAYKIPNDRNMRLSALSLFVKAVRNHGLKVVGFDEAFFDTILPAYNEAFEASQKTDSTVAVNVSNKNDLRRQVEAVLNALHGLIRINYPNTYEGELRSWGFQKEKY